MKGGMSWQICVRFFQQWRFSTKSGHLAVNRSLSIAFARRRVPFKGILGFVSHSRVLRITEGGGWGWNVAQHVGVCECSFYHVQLPAVVSTSISSTVPQVFNGETPSLT